MKNGRVYWITGLSNSGKTTIGAALYYDLRKENDNVVILDGDLMKEITSGSETAEYELADRFIRAKRYSLMAKLLSDQGITVIVCAIAMFEEVRLWNRRNIKGYIEIFLNVPENVLLARDKKGLVGTIPDIQFPKHPDLVVNNDGQLSVKQIVEMIKELEPKCKDDYDRDKDYWNDYYRALDLQKADIAPSSFAIEVEKLLPDIAHILELGCGNGRDSMFFASKGHNVLGVDGAEYAIEQLNMISGKLNNVLFVCDDFVKCHSLYQMQYDCIYSRFTLHAINDEQEDELLRNAYEALRFGGMLCIEARTTHDEIYGKGEKIGKNTYVYNSHFRRFIDVEEFQKKLIDMGYEIKSLIETNGLSVTEDSDPVLMRCVAVVK